MYFPFYNYTDGGKRLGEGRRHNCAVLPKNNEQNPYMLRR